MELICEDIAGEDPILAWFAELELELAIYLGKQNDFATWLHAKSLD